MPSFPIGNGPRDNREYALVARVATARFSQNLFPIGFSRNGPLKMEKRDALQTGVCVLERLSGSIGIERCYLTRDAICTPQFGPGSERNDTPRTDLGVRLKPKPSLASGTARIAKVGPVGEIKNVLMGDRWRITATAA